MGLKNAGNVCYFNSLVHIYNCLPAFRSALLLWPHPTQPLGPHERFVTELQRLLALLAESTRRYVDGAAVVRLLLEASGQKQMRLGNQEDPTEFNMLFLEYVGKGLKQLAAADPARLGSAKLLLKYV